MDNERLVVNQEGTFKCSICGKMSSWELKVQKPSCVDFDSRPLIKQKPKDYVKYFLKTDKKITIIVTCDKCNSATCISDLPLVKD